VKLLAEQSTLLDSLRDSAEESVRLLRERRSALISAAVTGKIDVRHAA
jgi:type I restriction enzyme S subunit